MPRTIPNEIKTAAVAKLADMSEPTLTSCLLYRRILLQVSMITIKVLFLFPRGHTSCSAYTKVSDAFPSQPLSIFIILPASSSWFASESSFFWRARAVEAG